MRKPVAILLSLVFISLLCTAAFFLHRAHEQHAQSQVAPAVQPVEAKVAASPEEPAGAKTERVVPPAAPTQAKASGV